MANRFDNHRLGKMLDVFMLAHEAETKRLGEIIDAYEKRQDIHYKAFEALMSVKAVRDALTPECVETLRGIIDPADYED